MAPRAEFGFREFGPAVEYFRDKVNLPTRTWRDLWQGQHTRAFVVAGATSEDLLSDFRATVDAAISGGETLEQFRKRFREITQRHGWQYNGSPGWRSRVIYQTNVRTAYMAGRYRQMTDPAVLERMPWWQYEHNTVLNPREEHKAWDGKVFVHDDPFWRTHFPPNGWGCRCSVRQLSDRQLRKLGKSGPDPSPGAGAGGVPEEWAYNVGEAAYGRPVADPALRQLMSERWTAEPGAPASAFGRPDKVPIDDTVAQTLPTQIEGASEVRAAWRAIYGPGAELRDPSGARVQLTDAVVEHWLEAPSARLSGRQQYIPIIREVIEHPYEVWVNWARNERGMVGLRRYYVKRVRVGGRALTLVAQTQRGGIWTAFDFFSGRAAQPSVRQGHLIWGRP